MRVIGLKVDYLDCPLGLENRRPHLSWRLESSRRSVRQTAYRIKVALSEADLQSDQVDLWDSGIVESSKQFGIPYEGGELKSRQRCWWMVQVWDERKVVSESTSAWWEMGLLDPKDWIAQWLAVEDAIVKADREAGLHWIWGSTGSDEQPLKFRYWLRLPEASTDGELFAVANDWSLWTQITRIWIDGVAVAGSGAWVEAFAVSGPESDTARLALGALAAGEHLIAVEVRTAALPPLMANNGFVHGLALFARLNLNSGATLRLGTSPDWKTSIEEAQAWYTPGYDDRGWEAARAVMIDGHQPWPAQPARWLRREFSIDRPVIQARLYATALGAYEARLNGSRVGDALLTPEISQYAERLLYRVYDVTALLRLGTNALGLTVGDGWYASFDDRYAWGLPPRRVLAQLELVFAEGPQQVIATGPGWRTTDSAIRSSEIKIGEIYDARLEQPGWDTTVFDDSNWHDADLAAAPTCRLVAQASAPIRAQQILKPRAIFQPKIGVHIVDFGQNFAGWCRLHVKGPRGTRVELRFAEVLAPSGDLDESYMSVGKIKRDIFTLRGTGFSETFEPHFTYRGFRYVQVSGLPVAPILDTLEGVVIHTDLEFTGQFNIDSPLIQQIWGNTLWTQKSNFVGIPTDCPSREQRGFMMDAGEFWDAAAFNMDVCAFTSRQMDNVIDDQATGGAFPMVAPEPRHNNAFYHVPGSPPAWGDGGIILPWTVWRRYGDLGIIERNWDAMNRYLWFILNNNPDYIWRNQRSLDFGDWMALSSIGPASESLPPTPNELFGTAYWAHSADLLAQMADAVGRAIDRDRLRVIAARVRRAFNDAFVKPDGIVGTGSQTCYLLAVTFQFDPEGSRSVGAIR